VIRRPLHRGLACLLSLVTLMGTMLITASPSSAELDPENLPPVPECTSDLIPEGAQFVSCVEIHLNSGSAKFGSIEANFDQPTVIRQVIGLKFVPGGFETVPVPGDGAGVTFPTVEVPGGLLGGIPILEDISLGPLTDVSATIVPTAPMTFTTPDAGALLNGTGRLTTATIPLMVKINNALLGDACTIGSPAQPINLNLDLDLSGGLVAAHFAELKASDTTFAIPAAKGCGPLGLGGLLTGLNVNLFDGLINQKAGLPSASGQNHITFDGVLAAKATF
jgi:hypothetical protein